MGHNILFEHVFWRQCFSRIEETTLERRLNQQFDRLENREGARASQKTLNETVATVSTTTDFENRVTICQCPSIRLTVNPVVYRTSYNHTQCQRQHCVFRAQKFVQIERCKGWREFNYFYHFFPSLEL